MTMRKIRWPGIVVFAVAVAAVGGCSSAHVQPDGAWTGCGSVTRATAVQIHRSMPKLAEPPWPSLSVTQRRAAVARSLYYDFCVVAGHPAQLTGTVSCPADSGLLYRGIFYAGDRRLASFRYAASGCQTLTLSAGSARASTVIFGQAAAAMPRTWNADLAKALGVAPDQLYQPPRR